MQLHEALVCSMCAVCVHYEPWQAHWLLRHTTVMCSTLSSPHFLEFYISSEEPPGIKLETWLEKSLNERGAAGAHRRKSSVQMVGR